MHHSANDIVSLSTNRETILIGSPGAFGVIHRDVLAHGRGEIGRVIAHIFSLPGVVENLRPSLRRWGVESTTLTRMDKAALRTWLSGQAQRGALAIAIVPDPMIAFAGHVHRQEHAMAKATGLREHQNYDGELLPPDIESRFLSAFEMVPQHLGQEARKRVTEIADTAGMEMLATGILIWVGSHFVPGLHLVVVASDRFAMSGEVMRAMETVGTCITDLQKLSKRSELEPLSRILAGAIAVLAINGVLTRLLLAKQITHGQSSSTSGKARFEKPSASRRPARQKKPVSKSPPKPESGKEAPKAEAKKPGASAKPVRPIDDPAIKKGMREAWTASQASDPAKRHEEGGYIVENKDGTLGVEKWPRGKGASITPPSRDASGQYNGKKVLGEFHTHPNPPVDETGKKWNQGGHRGDWDGIAGENYSGDSYIISDKNIYTVDKSGKPNLDAAGNDKPLGTREKLIGK